QKRFREVSERVVLPDLEYYNQEHLQQLLHRSEDYIHIGVQGDPADRISINSKTDLSWNNSKSSKDYLFNSIPLKESLSDQNLRFMHQMNYSQRINPRIAALLDLNF